MKNLYITKSKNKEIKHHVDNLFKHKHIENMAWSPHAALPEGKSSFLKEKQK